VRQLLHRARATLRAGASALTPVELLERIAELAGGAGAAKVSAALLATGAIAGGATLATPIPRHHRPPPVVRAAVPAKPKRAPQVRTVVEKAPLVLHRRSEHRGSPHPVAHHRREREHSGSDHSGPGPGESDDRQVTRHDGGDRRGSDEFQRERSGSDDHVTTTTPPTEDHTGSDSGRDGGDDGGSSGSGSDDRR
jgi:hypothetical protein